MPAMNTTILANIFSPDWWHKAWFRADGATDLARTTDETGMWLWWFCTLWFVFLMGLMVAFVAKYRRRKGQIAPKSPSHNTPLEIAWTVIPTLFLVWIFFKGFWTYMDKMVSPSSAVMLDLRAWKWNWGLTYPNGAETNAFTVIGARQIPVFYIPADVNIKLRLQSDDVMHSFFVPDFRTKTDIFPNRYTTTWFKAKMPSGAKLHPKSIAEVESYKASAASKGLNYSGPEFVEALAGVPYEDHWLFCAEYCGDEHSEMAAIFRTVPEDAYNRWVLTIADDGTMPLVELGEQLFKRKGCGQCHTIDGAASTGPTWKHAFGTARQFTSGESYSAEQMSDVAFFSNYARESILTPSVRIVRGFSNQMTPYAGQLSERQLDALIAYIMSLGVNPPAVPEPAAEGAAPEGTAAPNNPNPASLPSGASQGQPPAAPAPK
jgi:cytochrome c oxidase subunit 2